MTGGTGLLGAAVVRALRNRGDNVLALLRRKPDKEAFDGLDVDFVYGDLAIRQNGTSLEWLKEAVECSSAVIHCAAHVHIGRTQLSQSLAVNQAGTQAIAAACLSADRRLVHVGTVNTLAVGAPDCPANEITPITASNKQIECAYTVSKRASVASVTNAVSQGLNAVIVHPGFMLGPWDWRPSSGQLIVEFAKRWMPLAPSGGCSVCDSRDVATAIVRAMDTDLEPGREFIMAGHNVSYLHLFSQIARRLNRRVPSGVAPAVAQHMVGVFSDLSARIPGRESSINGASIRMAMQHHWYDSSRARNELNYRTRPFEETLNDAVAWLAKRHNLERA